ncbi:MAG: hypothetical protein ABSA18_12950 [Dehalococcoidia bacterium]
MSTMYPDFSALTVKELLAMTLHENSSSEVVTWNVFFAAMESVSDFREKVAPNAPLSYLVS